MVYFQTWGATRKIGPYCIYGQQMPRPDCTYVQSGLGLYCPFNRINGYCRIYRQTEQALIRLHEAVCTTYKVQDPNSMSGIIWQIFASISKNRYKYHPCMHCAKHTDPDMSAHAGLATAPDNECIHIIFLLFLRKMCYEYSLEVPQWGASNKCQ